MAAKVWADREPVLLAGFALAATLAGCASLPLKDRGPATVRSQDKAAVVLVAPTMVSPWSDVSAALKPSFTMTGDTAVTEVLPTTETVQQQSLSALGASLGLGFVQPNLVAAKGQGQTATAPTTPSGIPAGASLPALPATTGLSMDPDIKYQAAASLFEKIQLLNQEIDHLAVRDCFIPYVVKLKVALMTYRPNLAYSVHTRVSFLPSGWPPPGRALSRDVEAAEADLTKVASDANTYLHDAAQGKVKPQSPKDVEYATSKARWASEGLAALQTAPGSPPSDQDVDAIRQTLAGFPGALAVFDEQLEADRFAKGPSAAAAAIEQACRGAGSHVPLVIPFLVADDLSVAMKARAAEVAQQLGLAISYAQLGIGGSASVNKLNQSLASIANQQLSSALTVGRENDNTLYFHIEPQNVASASPNLVGRTYDVAVVLLVPREYFGGRELEEPATPRISFVSYTQFRDAAEGGWLPQRPDADLYAKLDRVAFPFLADSTRKKWKDLSNEDKGSQIEKIYEAVEQGNYTNFKAALAANIYFKSETIWPALSVVFSDNAYKTGSFTVPTPRPVVVPQQTVLLPDDGSSPIQAVLGGVGGVSASSISALLITGPAPAAETPLPIEPGCKTAACKTYNALATIANKDSQAADKSSAAVKAKVAKEVAEALKAAKAAGLAALATPQGGAPPSSFQVPAQSVSLDPSTHLLTLTFPSLSKLGLTQVADGSTQVVLQTTPCRPAVELCGKLQSQPSQPSTGSPTQGRVTADSVTTDYEAPAKVTLAAYWFSSKPSTPASGLVIGPSSGVIVIQPGGAGSLVISLTKLPTGESSAALSITGADLSAITPIGKSTALTFGKNGYVMTGVGNYTVSFVDLNPGASIAIKAQGLKSDGTLDAANTATLQFTAITDPAPNPRPASTGS